MVRGGARGMGRLSGDGGQGAKNSPKSHGV